MKHLNLFGRATLLAALLVWGIVYLAPGQLRAQSTATADASPGAGQNDFVAGLTAEQSDQLRNAVRLYKAGKASEALVVCRQVLSQLPPGTQTQLWVAKYAASVAIKAEQGQYAIQLLKPIETADANDWQTAAMLAQVYAETGQKELRDAELSHLVDLHKRAVSPEIAKMQQVLLERIPLTDGSATVWYSLEPWGRFKTYLFCRIYDQAGNQIFRVTLESSDFDQPAFAKENPDLEARGMRRFSLDGYGEDVKLPDGGTNHTHFTFGFFDGQPAYDVIRERIVAIAEGQLKPLTQLSHTAP